MKSPETIYYKQHKTLAAKNIYSQGDLNTWTLNRFSTFFFLVHIQFIELFYLSIIIYPDMLCVFFVFRGDILYMNMI